MPRVILTKKYFNSTNLLLLGLVVTLVWLNVVPVGMLVWSSFLDSPRPGSEGQFTLENYVNAYVDEDLSDLFVNTFVFTFGCMGTSLVLGSLLAFLITRTDTPLRRWLPLLIIVPIVFPPFLRSIAWILLLSPRIGLINLTLMKALNLESAPFNIFSMEGMIFVRSMGFIPIVYLSMSAAFQTMDSSFEEIARISGARIWRVFVRITIPLARPTLLALAVLLFVYGIESFETPLFIGAPAGIQVFASEIYWALYRGYPAQYGYATALSSILLLMAGLGLWTQSSLRGLRSKYSTIVGKSHAPSLLELGRWKYVSGALILLLILIMVVLPFLVLLLASLLPYFAAPSWELLKRANFSAYLEVITHPVFSRSLVNTVFLAVAGSTIAMLLVTFASYIVSKTRTRGRTGLEALIFIPLAIPGVVLAVGLMWTYIALPVPIYGTIWILLIAYVVRHLPAGSRFVAGSMDQIDQDLVESASVCGARLPTVFRRIAAPLVKPAVVAGWVYGVLFLMREFTSAAFLSRTGTEVLPMVVFDFWGNGYTAPTCALAILMLGMMMLLLWLAQRVLGISLMASRV